MSSLKKEPWERKPKSWAVWDVGDTVAIDFETKEDAQDYIDSLYVDRHPPGKAVQQRYNAKTGRYGYVLF